MFFGRACQTFLLLTAVAVTPAFGSRVHRQPTAHHRHRFHIRRHHHVVRGQRGIDSERATQIQAALIKQHYLTGAPSGEWDSSTEAAMQKFQADHGWQTKMTPDSRALIALGLGPDHSADGTPVAGTAAEPAPVVTAVPAENTLASTHILQN
ncbi:MAG TPA: peptidoglycan-binding domain-containing protein [Acidobacteriaceae bacterium]|nr:peptidoglycan-binding domain-containing protein [Acidobacteriaceae bacterium]